jgi:hypothetical protein
MKRLLTAVAASAALLASAGSASAAGWQNVPLPAPPGGHFSVPAGYVGDLSFWSPNRGLMTVAGNASVPAGLYSWDGESWHQLSTVCGGGINARIAWAGPTEFWTITTASVGPKASGAGLCHYKDGAVVGSYSYFNVPEFGPVVNAATCRAADDCLFGGVGAQSVDGSRIGAFHLRWDGTDLKAVWNGQGRGVSDLISRRGTILESTFVGTQAGGQGTIPFLRQPEPTPALLHRVAGTSFSNDPFVPRALDGVPLAGTELRAMDTDGTTAWAVGGGAGSGPATADGNVQRPPIALRNDGDQWQELELSGASLPSDQWFGPVAAVPGTRTAWTALSNTETAGNGGSTSGEYNQPTVASIAADGRVAVETLDANEGPAARGAATAIACPAADDCWVATAKGFLYRRTTAGPYARDTDPAFQGTISIRPNEAASQVIPDDPPADDSRLLAPPVELPDPSQNDEPGTCTDLPALVSKVKATRGKLSGKQARQANPKLKLTVRFRLARPARVGLRARRGGRTVATVKPRKMKPGSRSVQISVRRKQWPKAMKFLLTELTKPDCSAGSGSSVVGTGETR